MTFLGCHGGLSPSLQIKHLVNVSKWLLLVLVTQLCAFKRLMSCFCLEGPRL